MNFESVRSIIDTYIKKNGVEAITGDILNNVLNTMLDDVDTAISSIEPSPGGGGGGTADLSNYYTKAQSDARYLALSGGGQVVGSTDTPLYLKSGVSNSYIGFKNSSDSILGYYGFRGTTPIVYSGASSAYYLIHSGNIESYALPYSGGTINGTITFSSSNPAMILNRASSVPYMEFGASSSLGYGDLGVNANGDAVFWSLVSGNSASNAWHPLIHSGNIGSYAPIYNANGNVLIGTTTDLGYKLDISGNVRITNSLELGAGRLDKYTLYSQVSGFKLIDKDNVERLGLYSYDKSCFIENLYGGVENCGIQFFDSGKIRLFGGNVGIGIENPSTELDVNGTIATNQYIRINAWTGYGSGSCDMWYDGGITTLEIRSSVKITKNLIVSGDVASA